MATGGFRCPNPCAPVQDVELYDQATDTWTSLGGLREARAAHTTTVLADGQVLVAGGFGDIAELGSSELSVADL